jgi:hypothetical protein
MYRDTLLDLKAPPAQLSLVGATDTELLLINGIRNGTASIAWVLARVKLDGTLVSAELFNSRPGAQVMHYFMGTLVNCWSEEDAGEDDGIRCAAIPYP